MLKMRLQLFAGEVDDQDDNQDDIDNNDDQLSGEEELLKAIKSLQDSEDDEDEESDEDVTDEEDDDTSDDELEDDESDEDDEDVDNDDDKQDDKGKKKQTKEENAKFAAQRRQQELEKKVQAELERLKQESPEFQLAKQLSDMYGRPADEIMAEMREAALQKEAKEKNLPLELLRERQAEKDEIQSLRGELNQLRYESWQNRIKADGQRLMGDFKMLTQEDMDAAVDYILQTVKNVDMPLEQAVYALHGKKIIENLAKEKVQDDLAEQSGRKKKTPLAPNNRKSSKQQASLTADERAVAKAFGMSDEEYLKYK